MTSKLNPEHQNKKKVSKKTETKDPVSNPFVQESSMANDKVFIECPGATIYEPGTRHIIAGVRFFDESNPSKGYEIVANPVYAPEHRGRRLVRRADAGCLRRCQACQDLTVRMMRREGPDFYIPNSKHPRKRQLRSIDRTW
jgi:hypothetical protein